MNLERDVDRWVLQELVTYYFGLGSENMEFNVSTDHCGNLTIHASGKIPFIDELPLDELRRSLNNGRAAEVELYYGQLAEVQQGEVNLQLLGDLIDWGKVTIANDVLYISVFRNNNL
ncbi:MAG TPA: hypothetical protein GX717_07770 [Clostridiaceae bacterium]|nr:hypothetical protein [Clostridiaceae bacterium]